MVKTGGKAEIYFAYEKVFVSALKNVLFWDILSDGMDDKAKLATS